METYSKSEKEQKPVTLPLEHFQNQVAVKHGLGNSLVTGHKASYFNEAAELYASSLRQENQQLRELVDAQNAYIKFLLDYEKALAPHLSASGIVPSRSIVTEGSQLREKILVAEQALQNTKGK